MEQIIGIDLAMRVFQVNIVSAQCEEIRSPVKNWRRLLCSNFRPVLWRKRVLVQITGHASSGNMDMKLNKSARSMLLPSGWAVKMTKWCSCIVEADSRPRLRFALEKSMAQQDIQFNDCEEQNGPH